MQLLTIDDQEQHILRQPAEKINFPLSAAHQQFLPEFLQFFHSLESPFSKPAGLAAPQVGVSLPIIVFQIDEEAKKVRKDVFDIWPPTVFINPQYQPLSEAQNKDWEACYSVPEQMGEVYRYNEIAYEAYDVHGKKIAGIARGFFARCLQHEIDHVHGRLYIDLLQKDCRFGPMDEMMQIRRAEFAAARDS